jgi:cullin 3
MVTRERSGDVIDRSLMRSITMMLVDLGMDVYQDEFERSFLQTAAEAYQAEAQEYLVSCDCPDYLRKADKRLAEEVERVRNYMDPGSEAKITRVVETELIQKQMKMLMEMENSGFFALVEGGQYEDLGRMYSLFKRAPGGLDLLRSTMGDYIRSTGRALVQDPEKVKDPVEFVQQLLTQKDKFDAIVLRSFQNDKAFQNTLNQAFEHFINLNQRSPEYISLFMDDKLRKGLKGTTEDEAEAVLDKVMMLFRYIQEKDIFEKYYKQHLAKRLLSGRTVSDDAERSLLVKLKTECGYQFTSKLESMFNDIKTSRDSMLQFKAYCTSSASAAQHDIDLSVQVLTTGSWPTQSAAQCSLPLEMERCCTGFQAYYLKAHSGRKLTWQTNMGSADLKAVFGSKRHELNVSTYQACILMLFNESETLSFSDVSAATGIPPAELKRNLQSLACVKGKNVLRKEPMGKEVEESDVFSVNDGFTSKFYKVKVGTISAQRDSEPEKLETRQKVEEDRKPQIEAAIVRIMKARRVLDHNSIVTEVTRQLSARFLPNPTVIKKRIESLIEREFLERDTTDRKLYRYLA